MKHCKTPFCTFSIRKTQMKLLDNFSIKGMDKY